MTIQRITMFKVPDEKNVPLILDSYKTLEKDNEKDGKPYILEIKARHSLSGDRGKGYNVVAMTRFKDMEDVKYYDNDCKAHKALKENNTPLVKQPVEAPLTVFFED